MLFLPRKQVLRGHTPLPRAQGQWPPGGALATSTLDATTLGPYAEHPIKIRLHLSSLIGAP
eukprot:5821174-Lingulodinium_polyedra.AAC.1